MTYVVSCEIHIKSGVFFFIVNPLGKYGDPPMFRVTAIRTSLSSYFMELAMRRSLSACSIELMISSLLSAIRFLASSGVVADTVTMTWGLAHALVVTLTPAESISDETLTITMLR